MTSMEINERLQSQNFSLLNQMNGFSGFDFNPLNYKRNISTEGKERKKKRRLEKKGDYASL